MLAYGLATFTPHVFPAYVYGGWWWWWWIIILFVWLLVLPPFGYGRRWYGVYRTRYGSPAAFAYMEQWQAVEARFIDSPAAAVQEADAIVSNMLRGNNDPALANDYRTAHAVTDKARNGEATTDELRGAMLAFRAIFEHFSGGTSNGGPPPVRT